MKKTFVAALLAATCALSTSAIAAPIAMDGSFGTGNMTSGAYNAVFSGKSFLPEQYTVNNLSFSFTFLDDGSDNYTKSVATGKTKGDYKAHPWGSGWKYRDVAITNTTTKTYEQESATLSIGGFVLGNGSTSLYTTQETTGSSSAWHYDGFECSKARTSHHCTNYKSLVTTTDIKVINNYKGGFTIAGIVSNQSIIDQLLNNDLLSLTLNVGGDLKLINGQVMLDYTKVELPAEVPEPSSILLGAAGLAAIGFVRRRRSAAKA